MDEVALTIPAFVRRPIGGLLMAAVNAFHGCLAPLPIPISVVYTYWVFISFQTNSDFLRTAERACDGIRFGI